MRRPVCNESFKCIRLHYKLTGSVHYITVFRKFLLFFRMSLSLTLSLHVNGFSSDRARPVDDHFKYIIHEYMYVTRVTIR